MGQTGGIMDYSKWTNGRGILWQVLLVGLSIVLALAGCAQSVPDVVEETGGVTAGVTPGMATPRQGGALILGMDVSSIMPLDPASHSDRATETVIRNIFDGLVTRTTDNQVVLELAKDYRWVGDKTIEFDLKQGVKFHNGEDLTAEDVVFTIERLLNQEIGAPRRVFVKEVESVEKMGDHTVRFNLKSSWPVFLQMLVHTQIVPKDYLTRLGDESFARNPVGCGPFRFVEGKLDEQVVLERFDDYYGGAFSLPPVGPPHLDRVIFRMMPDASARLAAQEDGTVHIMQSLAPYVVPQLVSNPDITVKTTVGTRPKLMELNVTLPPFDDVRVRQALSYAVDADAALTKVAAGYGVSNSRFSIIAA